MKYLKALGLAAIAAGALMAFVGAGTASATELWCTEPPGTETMCPAQTHIHAEAESTVTLHPPIGDISCTSSTVTGHTTNTGSPTETVDGPIETLTFGGCNATVTVLEKGELIIHTTKENEDNRDGTLTSTGAKVTVEFSGFHCIFKTSATDIGWLTGSTNTPSHTPTLDISATIPRTEGRSGAFCGTSAQWTGNYSVTAPMWMDVT